MAKPCLLSIKIFIFLRKKKSTKTCQINQFLFGVIDNIKKMQCLCTANIYDSELHSCLNTTFLWIFFFVSVIKTILFLTKECTTIGYNSTRSVTNVDKCCWSFKKDTCALKDGWSLFWRLVIRLCYWWYFHYIFVYSTIFQKICIQTFLL